MILTTFTHNNLYVATVDLFSQLGIPLNSSTTLSLDLQTVVLGENYKDREPFTNVTETYFAGRIDDSVFETNHLFDNKISYEESEKISGNYNGLMLFALKLDKKPTRTEISELTRAFNQKSLSMPVALLLCYPCRDAACHVPTAGSRHATTISLALPERFLYKQSWRQGEKVGKVIILRDIDTVNTHAGHLRILEDLAKHNAANFNELHKKWLSVLNINVLNKDFYNKLLEWYKKCYNDIKIDLTAASKILKKDIDNELRPQAVIRVIIRMMFIWFMKEKRLIKSEFFTPQFANDFLKNKNTYYNVMLQNIFFATLNNRIEDEKDKNGNVILDEKGEVRNPGRRWRKKDAAHPYDAEKNDYGVFGAFRFQNDFKQGKDAEFFNLTKSIPYINGGLFTCHDYKFAGKDEVENKLNKEKNYIIDGFSDNPKDRAKIPDSTIFALIDLFSSYVWTIEESTPEEQDIALDPELLGTIFENLIGFYNPETKENARKQTGSFYTPKEIVEYMCRESFKETLKTRLPALSADIDNLVENNEDKLDFPNKNNLLAAITSLKILDPACGSGAFPMGMFNLMVQTVEKLQEHKTTYRNKLDIIQNCIYGVDIQNIAVEISKLRFFISLLVDYETPDNIADFEVLPNLETKFAVANTLIGIDLKKNNSILFDFNAEFRELTEIFMPFTTAKTPSEKTLIKNDFEKKKNEIVNNPHSQLDAKSKQMLSAWNPFNVCYCSPFFDSGIMFGISDGFDVVMGNPPYGADIDDYIKIFEKLYPKTSHGFKDIYKYFFDKSLTLLKSKGILSFITPNTFLRQPRYSDLRRLLLEYSILQLVDLGEHIFEAVVPTAISMISTQKNENVLFADLTKFDNSQHAMQNIDFTIIKKQTFKETQNNLFIANARKKLKNEFLLDDVLEMKDCGFKYQRSNVGMREKGKNDLAERIFYSGKKQDENDIPILIGKDINAYFSIVNPDKKLRHNYQSLLKNNEGTYYNKKIMSEKIKLIWRQTAPFFIGTILKEPVFFGNTIQAGTIKEEFKDKVFYEYLCGLLNSKYLRYLYEQNVKEEGRVFPQVKLEKLKILPVVIANNQQQPIITLVTQILDAKRGNSSANTTALEREIDCLVYRLYGLSEEEIEIIEGKRV